MKTTVSAAVTAFIIIAFCWASCTRIAPTEAGFKINNSGDYRGIDTLPLLTGWQWRIPFISKVITIPTTQQHIVWTASAAEGGDNNEEITVSCLGGAGFKMDVGLNYRVDPYKASKIYLKYNTDNLQSISETYLRNAVRGAMQDVSGALTVDSILNNLPAFEHSVNDKLSARLSKEGFIVDLFNIISQPRPTDAQLAASINQKIKAKQDAETSIMQLQQSIAEANKKIAEARGDSTALVINASATAEANAKMLQTLTPLLIQKQYIEKWDGKLPVYSFGQGTTTLLNLPKE